MAKSKRVAYNKSGEMILSFFEGDLESADLFATVSSDMINSVPELFIRGNDEIIGVAGKKERYRFYVLKDKVGFLIKYKIDNTAIPFVAGNEALYLEKNAECNKYVSEHPEAVTVKVAEKETKKRKGGEIVKAPINGSERVDRDEITEVMAPLLSHVERAFNAEQTRVPVEEQRKYYLSIEGVIKRFSEAFYAPRENDVMLYRILGKRTVSLRDLGKKHNVSGEFIRQIEKKLERKTKYAFRRSTKAVFAPWREELCKILMSIDESYYISAIAYMTRENRFIGDLVSYVSAPEGQYDEIREKVSRTKLAILSPCDGYELTEKDSFDHEVMKAAARYYHEQLRQGEKSARAIETIRSFGIGAKDMVRLGLGVNDGDFSGALTYLGKTKNIPIDRLIKNNIVGVSSSGKYYDKMRNSVIIPTVDTCGNVVCFDYYSLTDDSFIYYPKGAGFNRKRNIYSLNLAVRSQKKSVVVVSDYMAYFALFGSGIDNVVSTYMPNISEDQMYILKKHFKVIILAFGSAASYLPLKAFCEKNDMYLDRLEANSDPAEYVISDRDLIMQKIEYYESIFSG